MQVIFWLAPKLYFGLQPKLYFDFVKVIFRLTAEVKVILSTTCPQGKYHCRRQYHCNAISRRRHITAIGNFVLRNDRVLRTAKPLPKKSEFLDFNSLKTARNFSLKSQNFDEIVVFSAGFKNSSVLGVHEFSSSAEKAEYRKIMTFYHHLLWTFSANPTISFTSITVPSSRIALPLNLPNT